MGILAIDPFESLAAEIELVERLFVDEQSIQIAQGLLDPCMGLPLEQFPLQLAIVVPFMPLGQFPAHEEHLLARMGPHVGKQQTQVSELLPKVTWHLSDQGTFAVDHFIVREGELKILRVGIDQAESQIVLVMFAMDRIAPHVAKRVVHPTHIPLHRES